MNGKTMGKTWPRCAEICGSSLKSIKERTTFLRHSVQFERENSPTQTLASRRSGKTFAPVIRIAFQLSAIIAAMGLHVTTEQEQG